MFSFLKELSAEDKRIKCFNYLDWNKSYKSSIKRSKGKLIIIDNADILLDDAMRSYIALDGNNQLCDCTEAVLTTLDKDMRRSQPRNYSAKRDGDRETFDIIYNLRKQKNGAKFIKLFDKGDFNNYGS